MSGNPNNKHWPTQNKDQTKWGTYTHNYRPPETHPKTMCSNCLICKSVSEKLLRAWGRGKKHYVAKNILQPFLFKIKADTSYQKHLASLLDYTQTDRHTHTYTQGNKATKGVYLSLEHQEQKGNKRTEWLPVFLLRTSPPPAEHTTSYIL